LPGPTDAIANPLLIHHQGSVLVDPVKTPVENGKLCFVQAVELNADIPPCQCQRPRIRFGEDELKCWIGFVETSDRDGILGRVFAQPVTHPRIVHGLNADLVGKLKDHSLPAGVVGR